MSSKSLSLLSWLAAASAALALGVMAWIPARQVVKGYRANVARAQTVEVQHATSTAITARSTVHATILGEVAAQEAVATQAAIDAPLILPLHPAQTETAAVREEGVIPVTYAPTLSAPTSGMGEMLATPAMRSYDSTVTPVPFWLETPKSEPTLIIGQLWTPTLPPTSRPTPTLYVVTVIAPTATLEPTLTTAPTPTDAPTFTPTPHPTPPAPTDAPKPTSAPTATALPLPTAEPSATPTVVPTATDTPTLTPEPTATETMTPTLAATVTDTDTPAPTATETSAPTATDTATPVPLDTETPTPTVAPSETATETPTEVIP